MLSYKIINLVFFFSKKKKKKTQGGEYNFLVILLALEMRDVKLCACKKHYLFSSLLRIFC